MKHDEKLARILVIAKIVFTLIFMIALSIVEPVFLYIFGASLIIAIPIILTFIFINKR